VSRRPAPVIVVPVRCTYVYPDWVACQRVAREHVHQPLPCPNGNDGRHHDFTPPKTVRLDLGRRIAVVRP